MKLTPGDVADRLSVLSVKMSRMPRNKALWGQFCEAQVEWHSYQLDAQKEFEALTDVNLAAYDIVELIYNDFRDPHYGTASWAWQTIPLPTLLDMMVSTVKNCRKAHELNMERVRLKNAINAKAGAAQEVKSW
jgi:hypothetical protein